MIDKVKLNLIIHIDDDVFSNNDFHNKKTNRTQETMFYKEIDGTWITYFYNSKRIIITGRIITFHEPKVGYVCNFDDVMIDESISFDEVLDNVQYNLFKAFFPNDYKSLNLNLNDFVVTYIEYCINVNVQNQKNVDAYIKMMNLLFIDKGDKRYKNYPLEDNKGIHTSCYIKPNKKYEKNSDVGNTINFYNKYNQLLSKKMNVLEDENKDMYFNSVEQSKGILRLEVKLGSQALFGIKKEFHIEKQFIYYQNIDIARDIICKKIGVLFSSVDLCSLNIAKTKIEDSESLKPVSKKHILEKYTVFNKNLGHQFKNQKRLDYDFTKHYKDMVKSIGLNPILIPTKWKIDYLENPIKLIDKKIELLE